VFESEEVAKAAAEMARSAPPAGANMDDIQVAEVVAHA
jgi:hypothetical protein